MPTAACPHCQSAVDLPDGPAAEPVTCPACGGVVAPQAPDAAAADPGQDPFPVLPYQAVNAGRPAGLGLAVFFGLAAAVVVGLVAGLIRPHLWLIVIFPLFLGAAVGGLAGLGGRIGRARLPAATAAVGAGAALLAGAGLYYQDYLNTVPEPLRPLLGFWKYMDLRAEAGVTLGKPGANDKGMNLGYTGSVIYWLVELGITAAAGATAAGAVVSSPFCGDCHRWKTKRAYGPYRVEPAAAAAAVATGVPGGIATPADGPGKQATVSVYTCPNCGDQGTVDVEAVGTHTVKKQVGTVKVFMTYPGGAAAAFDEVDRQCRAAGLGG